ncbi:MAG TPA: hypothetical protein PLM52_10715 [Tabrizicola sp.]|nr:hypothetical protein [Tabrizicola sp.]
MSRISLGAASGILSALMLAACTPSADGSGGVGFQDYNSYIRGAQPAPAGAAVVPPPGAPTAGFDPAAAAAAIDRADGTSLPPAVDPYAAPLDTGAIVSGADRPRGGAPAGIQEESGEVASHTGISDEQDFEAVSARETIESDAERIARNRSEYVVVQPKDLPARPGDTGPNIVEFALATTHAPGVQMYKRGGIKRDSSGPCGKYASPDLAQQDFLGKGGPERDRMGVDPDGDGFACSWDPRPFRTALQ